MQAGFAGVARGFSRRAMLALETVPIIYGLLLVDGGLIKYDYRGLLAVLGVSFMTAWVVYQRSKYKDKSGEVIDTGATQSLGHYQGAEEIPCDY